MRIPAETARLSRLKMLHAMRLEERKAGESAMTESAAYDSKSAIDMMWSTDDFTGGEAPSCLFAVLEPAGTEPCLYYIVGGQAVDKSIFKSRCGT